VVGASNSGHAREAKLWPPTRTVWHQLLLWQGEQRHGRWQWLPGHSARLQRCLKLLLLLQALCCLYQDVARRQQAGKPEACACV
jgi:hypothetical protein